MPKQPQPPQRSWGCSPLSLNSSIPYPLHHGQHEEGRAVSRGAGCRPWGLWWPWPAAGSPRRCRFCTESCWRGRWRACGHLRHRPCPPCHNRRGPGRGRSRGRTLALRQRNTVWFTQLVRSWPMLLYPCGWPSLAGRLLCWASTGWGGPSARPPGCLTHRPTTLPSRPAKKRFASRSPPRAITRCPAPAPASGAATSPCPT